MAHEETSTKIYDDTYLAVEATYNLRYTGPLAIANNPGSYYKLKFSNKGAGKITNLSYTITLTSTIYNAQWNNRKDNFTKTISKLDKDEVHDDNIFIVDPKAGSYQINITNGVTYTVEPNNKPIKDITYDLTATF